MRLFNFTITATLFVTISGQVGCTEYKVQETTFSDQFSKTPGTSPEDQIPKKDDVDPRELQGNIEEGPFAGAMAIDFNKPTRTVFIKIPTVVPVGLEEAPIPKIPGAKVKIGPDEQGVWSVQVALPLEALLGRISFQNDGPADPTKLPNGKPLPAFPGGEPPTVTFEIPQISQEIQLYLGVNVAAVFWATPEFDPRRDLVFPIKNRTQKAVIGYFATVRSQNGFSGGFFHSIIVPPALARRLDELL